MQLTNREIARRLGRVADLLEIAGENAFRVRAYRNAADTVGELASPLTSEVEAGADLTALPHIGRDIAGQIETLVREGRLPALDEVARQVPPELADLMAVRGLGPKGVKALHDRFRVQSLDELEALARAGRTRELPGFGAKKEAALIAGIEGLRAQDQQRTRRADAEALVEPVRAHLAALAGVEWVEVAGSYRRQCDTVGDVDVVVACADPVAVMAALVEVPGIERVVSQGDTRATVILDGGLQLDARAVEPAVAGAALLYFTGSQAHNVALRQRARERGYRLNEYGLVSDAGAVAAGGDETAIYRALGLAWIPPELREGGDEIAAAATGRLPELVTTARIRGNLHGHTDWSDGRDSLAAMVAAARERGFDYLAITDHGPLVRVANGLSAQRLQQQIEAIHRLGAELEDIDLLAGCEVDIHADGTLDLPDEVLAQLDVVVCSIHYHLRQSRAEQTERVLRAMDNPHFMIWGHPTAREINRREPIDVDLDACFAAAAARGIAIEINAQPKRLDIDARGARLALAHGCRLCVNTDAHRTEHLDLFRHGIGQARRAGAEAVDVINTWSLAALRAGLRPDRAAGRAAHESG